MPPRLRALWDKVRTSLWAVPGLMMVAATGLAIWAVRAQIEQGDDPVWFLYSGKAADAPDFLSSLVTSMITMTTLAISITMVVLTLAAQQLGPRLIRIFMGDLRTQAALGLFIATVVYLLLVLRSVYGASDLVPNLAVTIGTALVLTSMVTLLLFVHHLARSIIADPMIDRVGRDLDANAARLLPEKERDSDGKAALLARQDEPGGEIRLDCEGYVQAIEIDNLVEAAESEDAVIALDIRAGHHIIAGNVFGRVFPAKALTPVLLRTLHDSILIGSERTPVQDLEFSIRQMVELAVRALSPGINDPYTAIITIDRLTLSLARILRRGRAQTQWCGSSGHARLTLPASTFEGQIDASFNMIRQYGQDSAAILIRLAESLTDLLPLADGSQRKDIERHLTLVLNAGRRNLREPADLDILEDRVARAGESR